MTLHLVLPNYVHIKQNKYGYYWIKGNLTSKLLYRSEEDATRAYFTNEKDNRFAQEVFKEIINGKNERINKLSNKECPCCNRPIYENIFRYINVMEDLARYGYYCENCNKCFITEYEYMISL